MLKRLLNGEREQKKSDRDLWLCDIEDMNIRSHAHTVTQKPIESCVFFHLEIYEIKQKRE